MELKTTLKDSTLFKEFTARVFNTGGRFEAGLELAFTESLFIAISKTLADLKKEKKTVAIRFADLESNFLMAAILEYHEPEAEDMPGNYSFTFSFDEQDLIGIELVIEGSSPIFKTKLARVAEEERHFGITSECESMLTIELLRSIKYYLDKNIDMDDCQLVELTHPNYFTATATRIEEAGKVVKVFSIEPNGEMCVSIKNDAGLAV